MTKRPIDLHGPAGLLEARLECPAKEARLAAVVAHPHPLYGGTMDNAVVRVASSELVRHGAAALRFNFRGVGHSEGSHDQGRGEVDDLETAERRLQELFPELPLWLVGYSFGAVMVLHRLAAGSRATGALLLAPPLSRYDFSTLRTGDTPLALVVGDQDDIAPAAAVAAEAGSWPAVRRIETLPVAHDLGTATSAAALEAAVGRCLDALLAR